MSPLSRSATAADAPAILDIYAPVVRDTAISFELEPPSVAEMQHRITAYSAYAPWLVYAQPGMVLGYAYAGKHRDRPAYQWSVEVSVYVHPAYQRQGIGQLLYRELFHRLRQQGFYNAYAGITLPNAASVRLHEAVGMQPLAVYHNIGFKLGRWHDVGWWHILLQPLTAAPEPPRRPPPVS